MLYWPYPGAIAPILGAIASEQARAPLRSRVMVDRVLSRGHYVHCEAIGVDDITRVKSWYRVGEFRPSGQSPRRIRLVFFNACSPIECATSSPTR